MVRTVITCIWNLCKRWTLSPKTFLKEPIVFLIPNELHKENQHRKLVCKSVSLGCIIGLNLYISYLELSLYYVENPGNFSFNIPGSVSSEKIALDSSPVYLLEYSYK